MAKLELNDLLGYAFKHGVDSEPEHEVGDLQELLTAAWGLMTDEQKATFMRSLAVESVVESTGSDEARDRLAETLL